MKIRIALLLNIIFIFCFSLNRCQYLHQTGLQRFILLCTGTSYCLFHPLSLSLWLSPVLLGVTNQPHTEAATLYGSRSNLVIFDYYIKKVKCHPLINGSEESAGIREHEGVPKHQVHCSRERSRTAWEIIDEYLMPFVEHEEYQIPTKCRLHPNNDMFREQEQHKNHMDINKWRCEFCKKSFYAEKYLDLHFDNRHSNLINDGQARCLADLCGVLHCDQMTESQKTKNKCNPAAVARNRHLCESLADSCFPTNNGQSASRLHELFLRQFCDAHTCDGGKKPFPRGGRMKSSIFYLACCILIVMLLPLFYLSVFLHQREMKKGIQEFKRISKTGRKSKPS